jgi:hypothetical protein
MTKDNPFPGMNPFLERHWSDVHTKLIAFIAEALAEQLPPDLSARSEERVTLHDSSALGDSLRADVAIVESWKEGVAPRWQPEPNPAGGVMAADPQIVLVDEETERWLEIRSAHGELITVIEVLSPSNKGSEQPHYFKRRDSYIAAHVNLVEIDLLRGGRHSVAAPLEGIRRPAAAFYLTCVTRASIRTRREVYVGSLREPLPNVSIPLRQGDADVILQLQPVIDRCYRAGSYWNADYTNVPNPPLGAEDAAWVDSRVKSARLEA